MFSIFKNNSFMEPGSPITWHLSNNTQAKFEEKLQDDKGPWDPSRSWALSHSSPGGESAPVSPQDQAQGGFQGKTSSLTLCHWTQCPEKAQNRKRTPKRMRNEQLKEEKEKTCTPPSRPTQPDRRESEPYLPGPCHY